MSRKTPCLHRELNSEPSVAEVLALTITLFWYLYVIHTCIESDIHIQMGGRAVDTRVDSQGYASKIGIHTYGC